MYEPVLVEHPSYHISFAAGITLAVGDVIALHLQRIVTVFGKSRCVEFERRVAAFLVCCYRQVGVYRLSFVTQHDVIASECLGLYRLVECHRQLVYWSLGNFIFRRHNTYAVYCQSHFRHRFELDKIASRLRSTAQVGYVQAIVEYRVCTVLHGIFRCPEVLGIHCLACRLVGYAEYLGILACWVGDRGIEPLLLRHGHSDAVFAFVHLDYLGDILEHGDILIGAV